MSEFIGSESGQEIGSEDGASIFAAEQTVLGLAAGSMLDIAITIYNPAGTTLLVEDVVTATDNFNSPIYSLSYEDTPDGCGAGSIDIGLYYDQFFDLGYWEQFNIVEISSGDFILQQATAAASSGTLKIYLDSIWQLDPARGEDSQILYINDGVNKTIGCPLQAIGYDNAPSIANVSSGSTTTAATTISIPITRPTAGNELIAVLTTDAFAPTTPAGWTAATSATATGLGLYVFKKVAAGSETSLAITLGASRTAELSVTEVAGGTLSAVQISGDLTGPALATPISVAQPIGSLMIGVFAIGNGAQSAPPAGWNVTIPNNPNPGLPVNYPHALWATSATDTNPYQGYASWNFTPLSTSLAGLTVLITFTPTGTPVPYAVVGMPAGGGGIPAYGPGAIVGRRRYSGKVAKCSRLNSKIPGGTVTLVGLQNTLQNALGTFLVALSAAQDVGLLCLQALQQFATSHFPFLTIPTTGSLATQTLFPLTGSVYSGNNSSVSVDQFVATVIQAIVSADQWNLRIGHDRVPRLIKYFDGPSNYYTYNVKLDQSSWSFSALDVEIEDQDTQNVYNAVQVSGSPDATGNPVAAIVLNTTQIAALGYQIDGPPQSDSACLTTLECELQAQALLEENSIASSANKCTVYTHDDVVVSSSAPGNMKRGDVVRGGINLIVTGFPGDAPNEYGLVLSVTTTLDFQKMESKQDVAYQAIIPDYAAQARQNANALATALLANGNDVGLDEYFVGQNAFGWTIVGLVVTAPLFEAVFALGSNPVNVGGTSFTLTASANNYVWLNPDGSWTVKVNDISPIVGSIPYAEFWTNATMVVGSMQRAQTGLLGITASYLLEGQLYTPVLTGAGGVGPPSLTVSQNGKYTSEFTIVVEVTNQPVDGSFAKAILYYRRVGQTIWLFCASSPPRNAVAGSDGNGAALTGGATSITGLYEWIYSEAANGTTFEFGFAIESNRGTETAVAQIGEITKRLSVPAGTTAALGTPTETVITTAATSITVNFSVVYTISGTTDMSWLDHINIMVGYYDPAVPSYAQAVHSIPASSPPTSATLTFGLQFAQNSMTAPTYRYYLYAQFVGADGSIVNSGQIVYTHA